MDRQELLNQVRRLRGESKSIRVIAVELGVHRSRVHRALKVLSQKQQGQPVGPAGSLIGTTFVGRERELGELRAAFDDAVNGNGRLVMVVGEPGIGKTALCKELARYVEEQGGTTLIGHCYEEGSLSLPYLPFVQAMRSYVVSRSEDDLRADLGDVASLVARIMPEIQDKLGVEPDAPTDPEGDRYRLLNGVTTFLTNSSRSRPLAIVLEDLHDADNGTLEMLTYLCGFLSETNAMVVGTYRDVEVDRAHPLSSALVELRRASPFARVPLRGLGLEDVRRMMTDVSRQSITEHLAVTVHDQTEGNPLFVQEVARYLREEQVLATGDSEVELRVPEGVRDVIGKRLSRLSKECNQMLAVASVIGREFDLDILLYVSSLSEDDLYTQLEEAQGASVVEESSGLQGGLSYRFSHAMIRETLYEEVFAPLRIRLHQRVGLAMEGAYAGQLEQHAAELAEHFANSSSEEDLTRALEYSEMAARHAQSVYSYGEAARLLEQALRVQQLLDPNDKAKRCDLMLALGKAAIPAGEPMRVPETLAPEALDLADAIGDRARAFAACRMAMDGLHVYGLGALSGGPKWRPWAERADELAEPGTSERVYTDWAMSQMSLVERRLGEAWKLRHGAFELARQLGEPGDISLAADGLLNPRWAPKYQLLQPALATELADMGPELLDVSGAATGGFIWHHLIAQGDRDRAKRVSDVIFEAAERTQDPGLLMSSALVKAAEATLDGRLEEAIVIAESIATIGAEHGRELAGVAKAASVSNGPRVLLGRAQEALEGWDSMPEYLTATPMAATRPWLLAEVGLEAEAKVATKEAVDEASTLLQDDEAPTLLLAALLAAALIVNDRPTVKLAAGKLGVLAHLSTFPGWVGCPALQLGRAGVLLGQPDEARELFQQALQLSEGIRDRPMIAVARLNLADLLLDHFPNERAEALEHLDFAITELRDMKMQPFLERALALQEGLEAKPVETPAYPDGLTQREVEVLRLVASGKSNAEIAAELVLSIRTVERHISNIYGKTRSGGRADATAFAFTRGLMSST